MKQETKQAIKSALENLSEQMQAVGLWQQTAPSPEALASTTPFCVDTMPLEAWLQWVFMPRLETMLQDPNWQGLAHRSDILSMADYVWGKNTDYVKVLAAIAKIDAAMNAEHPNQNSK